ncbi:protein phosphatase 2c 12 [Hordeum vulgare]|nr:protein phosphatase 2c 12 [Hordeum vulgare]
MGPIPNSYQGTFSMRGESAEATAEATADPAGVDPGAKGGGSNVDHVCGGEIAAFLPDDGETFAESRQPSCETKVSSGLPSITDGCSAGVHGRWEVRFSLSNDASRIDQFGSLVVHHSSGWATIRDAEGDILAGCYLIPNDLRIGLEIEMDGFQVFLLKPSSLGSACGEKIQNASVPSRVGGRFWVLADQDNDSDVEDDVPSASCSSVPSPISPATPLGVSVECKLQQDYPLPTRKKGASLPKPWIGPLPKVSRNPISLADFFIPGCCWPEEILNQRQLKPMPPMQSSSDVPLLAQSTRSLWDSFLAAAFSADGPALSTSMRADPRAGCLAQSGLSRPDVGLVDRQKDSGLGGRAATSIAGETRGQAGVDVNRMQPRGRWGDDRVNAYGGGQHRGSSSHGGGRGYAWQSNAGQGQGFSGPTGNFVPGPAGPKRGGYRQRWGGRGGGRRAPPQVDSAAADNVEQAQQPEAPPTSLPTPLGAVETVVALDKGDIAPRMEGGDRPTKWARKKEKMTCYRCGENGHFVSECSAVLCELCLKPVHGSSSCLL